MSRLAEAARLTALAQQHLSVPTDKGANAGMKVASLVTGMTAGADSIDDMAMLRHGAMPKVLHRPYAPSTLGSFLRSFAFGQSWRVAFMPRTGPAGIGWSRWYTTTKTCSS